MNSPKIEIKRGTSPQTIIDLSHYIDWDEALQHLENLFIENRYFWGNSPLVLQVGDIPTHDIDLENLKKFVDKEELVITKIITNNNHSNVNYFKTVSTKEESEENKLSIKPNLITVSEALSIQPNELNNLPLSNSYEKPTAYIMSSDNIALRSGQQISYDGNLIILGDTNPGCQVSATGSIIVYGKLCGTIKAGWNVQDDKLLEDIFIKCLLVTSSTQIWIGEHFLEITPLGELKKTKKKLNPETIRFSEGSLHRKADFS